MLKWKETRTFWLTALLMLVLDQVSKYLVVSRLVLNCSLIEVFQASQLSRLQPHEIEKLMPCDSLQIIPGFFNISFVTNRGIAFGLMPGHIWLFISTSLAAVVLLLFFFRSLDQNERLRRIACAFILGGALGNLIDRVCLNYVIDWIDLYWHRYHWPAFNVADTAICIGIGMFILSLLIEHITEHRQAPDTTEEAAAEEE